MIFSFVDSAQTAFRLGATNTRLMLIGERHIHRLMGTPKWGGDRLMCISDYSKNKEAYKGIDLGTEYAKFVDEADSTFDCDDEDSHSPNIYGYARWGFKIPTSEWWSSSDGCKIPISIGDNGFALRNLRLRLISYNLRKPDPPTQKAQVVWNLSKREYFCSRTIPKDAPEMVKQCAEPEKEILGLALLFQICRATHTGFNLAYEAKHKLNLHRGRWAGDRFEVTNEEVLQSRLKEKGKKWKNISGRVIGLCLKILHAEREP